MAANDPEHTEEMRRLHHGGEKGVGRKLRPRQLRRLVNPIARPFHRRLAPWLIAPLVVSAATGLLYRLGRSWFGLDRETGHAILDVHSGAWLGDTGSSLYLAATGLGLLALCGSGAWLLWRSRAKSGTRRIHRVVAWALLAPLTATALSGMAHHFGELWFDWEPATMKTLMSIHQGSWLGPKLRPFYVLWVGGGLLVLIASGLGMLWPRKARANAEKP
ncbi:MAG: hypothetical protein RLZZ50_959 [Verrucomicrobiota bacterium]